MEWLFEKEFKSSLHFFSFSSMPLSSILIFLNNLERENLKENMLKLLKQAEIISREKGDHAVSRFFAFLYQDEESRKKIYDTVIERDLYKESIYNTEKMTISKDLLNLFVFDQEELTEKMEEKLNKNVVNSTIKSLRFSQLKADRASFQLSPLKESSHLNFDITQLLP
jgi:hypothetical protein